MLRQNASEKDFGCPGGQNQHTNSMPKKAEKFFTCFLNGWRMTSLFAKAICRVFTLILK
jgi:hypothetical protein